MLLMSCCCCLLWSRDLAPPVEACVLRMRTAQCCHLSASGGSLGLSVRVRTHQRYAAESALLCLICSTAVGLCREECDVCGISLQPQLCLCVCVNAARLMCVFLPFKGSGDEDVARACLMCDALQCFSVSRRRAANVTLFLPRCCRVLLVSSVCHHMCVFVLKSPFSCARHGCCVSLS